MNTAHSTRTMAMTGPVTSCIAWIAASRGPCPRSRMMRSTFSSTTMASSTTMPIASTRPNSVSVLMEKPSTYRPAKVPMIDTGTASTGMSVARQLCRNRNTTSTTSAIASAKVMHLLDRDLDEARGVERDVVAQADGKALGDLLHGPLTSAATSMALAPGCR
jgi:hypothetical protein